MKTKYSLVHFLSTDDVDVVPTKWVKYGQCAWPPFKTGERVQKAVMQAMSAGEGWTLHPAKILRSFETYEQARVKLRRAEETSDINTLGDESFAKRKRKRRPTTYFSSSDDENDDERPSELPALPPTPVVEKSKSGNEKSAVTGSADVVFQKNVLKEISLLRAQIMHNRRLLEAIYQKLDLTITDTVVMCENGGARDLEICLPVTTHEELTNLEEDLRDIAYFKKMVAYLGRIGGTSISDATRRILRRTIADNLAVDYSLVGGGKKKSFLGLLLAKAVIQAVQESQVKAPESDVESAIRNWLRHSQERLRGRKGRSNGGEN